MKNDDVSLIQFGPVQQMQPTRGRLDSANRQTGGRFEEAPSSPWLTFHLCSPQAPQFTAVAPVTADLQVHV